MGTDFLLRLRVRHRRIPAFEDPLARASDPGPTEGPAEDRKVTFAVATVAPAAAGSPFSSNREGRFERSLQKFDVKGISCVILTEAAELFPSL
jgi:hypothetical protein